MNPLPLLALGALGLLALASGSKRASGTLDPAARKDRLDPAARKDRSVDRTRLGAQAWPTVPAGENRMGVNVGEGKIANYLRVNGIPVGPGGRLYLPSAPVSPEEAAAWRTMFAVIDAATPVPGTNPMGSQIPGGKWGAATKPVPSRIVPTVSFWSLDRNMLPANLRGPLSAGFGDDYSLGYWWTANVPDKDGNARDAIRLVDAYGREYPPGDYYFGGGDWLTQLGANLAHGIAYAGQSIGPALDDFKNVYNVVTSSPLWEYAAYAASYFPGWGSGLSAAMTMLKAYGEGVSLEDAAIRAARAAIPPYARAAYDVGVAVAHGGSAANIAEAAVRNEVPEEWRDTYDLGVAAGRKKLGV